MSELSPQRWSKQTLVAVRQSRFLSTIYAAKQDSLDLRAALINARAYPLTPNPIARHTVIRRHVRLTVSLRPILPERHSHHDQRADCDHHRADKRQLFQHADDGRPDAKTLFHMREASCHTHSDSSVGPRMA